jgi:pimeloyl-ACP methyl ester carboxylesterase
MNLIKKTTGTFQSFDGTEIHYEIRGEGKPLILNYGIGCLINHWRPQIRHFSETHQVIVYDYRAHHGSAVPADMKEMTADALAKDLRALMAHLQIEKASLWGHSFGVQMLMRAYELYPEIFGSLVFINGFVRNPLAGMFGNDLALKFFHKLKSGYENLPETVNLLWRLSIQNPLAIPLSALAGGFNLKLTSLRDIEIYARGISSMDLKAFITLFESMIDYDGTSVLEKIEVPTLIIGGRSDSVTPIKTQRMMHKKIKNSQLLLVPYGSHCTQLDMPDLVNLRISRFLREIGS